MTADRVSNERLAELLGVLPPSATPYFPSMMAIGCTAGNLRSILTELRHLRPPATVSDELADGWVVIKRGLYWRPKSQGYTGILSQAGIYSDEESAALSDGVEVTRQRFKEAAEVMPATYTDIERDYWREEALRLRPLNAALSVSHETGDGETQCCMCGKKGPSIAEGDGGTECQLEDGRWTCSEPCFEKAGGYGPAPTDETQGVKREPVAWRASGEGALILFTVHNFMRDEWTERGLTIEPLFSLSQLEAVERKLASEHLAFEIMVENNKFANAEWDKAVARAETAEASLAAAREEKDSGMAEFRDKVALGATDDEILRFRDGYPNPAGGSKILYRHTIEQARYRYADAVIAARAALADGESGR